MSGKRMVNVASIWIIVIFTVIAVTLVAIFVLVYSSILNREAYSTLREEATVLSDNADYQILETIRNEPARRLAMKSGLTETVQAVSRKGEAGSMEIQTLSNGCAAVCAAISPCDRLGLYFPQMQMAPCAPPFPPATGWGCIFRRCRWWWAPTACISWTIKNTPCGKASMFS